VDEGTPRVWCWGVGDDGQLANGDSVSSIDAVLATELPDAPSALTLSYHHTMALGSDGAIVGVGANPTRGLGVDALGDATAAVRASLVPAARRLTTGAADTCAILVDGRLACWGLSSKLETDTDPSTLTMGPRGLCSSTPTFFTLPTTEPIAGIAVVASQPSTAACVWTESSGEVYCVGDPPYATSSVEPTRVDGLTDVTDVVASDSALCALTRGGEVYCWGDDAHGQLGRGTHDDGTSATPTRVTLGP
jgi:alpha-tubulin suppressor-like RCC1 family protein